MMNHYKILILNHANLTVALPDGTKVPRQVSIVAGTIAGFHWMEEAKCTGVYTTGGIFPVLETSEQLQVKLEALNSPVGQESK